jgi:hypothetical protein
LKSPSSFGGAFSFVHPFVCMAQLSPVVPHLHPVYPQAYAMTVGPSGANMTV